MRYGQYKAHWVTGGAVGCNDDTGPVRSHDPPLLFDLNLDPAEAHALDTDSPEMRRVVAEMERLRRGVLADIEADATSVADYRTGPEGRLSNCCNASHVACRCQH